jgi:hypothetical protein
VVVGNLLIFLCKRVFVYLLLKQLNARSRARFIFIFVIMNISRKTCKEETTYVYDT